jgi:hypothetical protein
MYSSLLQLYYLVCHSLFLLKSFCHILRHRLQIQYTDDVEMNKKLKSMNRFLLLQLLYAVITLKFALLEIELSEPVWARYPNLYGLLMNSS